MLFTFDALVSSLALILPGFVVVGLIIAAAPSWEPIRLNAASFALLSLGTSVLVHLAYAYMATHVRALSGSGWVRPLGDFGDLSTNSVVFSVDFLKSLTGLMLLSLVIGALISLVLKLRASIYRRIGRSTPSQLTVWRRLFSNRRVAPNVLVLTNERAYCGQVTLVTTSESDSHLFLERVGVVPLDPTTKLPRTSPPDTLEMKGLLLDRTAVQEIWFLHDRNRDGDLTVA